MAAKKSTSKYEVEEHFLVSKHVKISEKEKTIVFQKHGITLKELPKIFSKDPAIKSLDVKHGDVIKIERNSKTAGKICFYRGVVNE